MNVLFVVGTFPTYSETFITNQINDLIDCGHTVYLLALTNGRADIKSSHVNRHHLVEKCKYQFPDRGLLNRVFHFICRKVQGKKYIQLADILEIEPDIDVVHCHFGGVAAVFAEIYLIGHLFNRARKVCTFHGYDMLPNKADYYKREYKVLLEKFDAFTYNTAYLGKNVIEVFPEHKCFELPVGFNENVLYPYYQERIRGRSNEHEKKFNIVFCGRLIALKGVLFLPKIAISLLQFDIHDFVFTIIGTGEESDRLKKEIEKNNLNDYFRLLGTLTQEGVFQEMVAGSIFIMPGMEEPGTGRAETQGLVVQEAQFLGLPSIVSEAGGLRYGVRDGETGYVLAIGDVGAFADRIKFFIKNPDKWAEFSQKSHTFAKENYNSTLLTRKLLKIYNSGDYAEGQKGN